MNKMISNPKKSSKFFTKLILLSSLILFVAVLSCNKNNLYPVTTAPSLPEFIAETSTETFGIGNASTTSTYIIPIGLTSASSSDTKIKISIASPTGAVLNSQYSISDSVITIPAGKVTDSSLTVSANFDTYKDDRVDTLVFTIESDGSSVQIESSKRIFTLVLRKSCPIVIDDLVGAAVIDDPNFWEGQSAAVVTKVDDNTLNISGIFDEPSYSFNVVINTTTGAVTVAKQVVGATLPTTSYTNPAIQATGKYDACSNVINLTSVSYSVTQGSFSGNYPLSIYKK